MQSSEIQAEIRRKAFHLVGLLIPGLYIFLDKPVALWILGIICLLYYLLELARKFNKGFNQAYLSIARPFLRDSEHHSIAGTTQFITGCWITILLFIKPIAIIAIYIFIFSDLSAAMIGKYFGKIKLIHNKSLEGTITCMIIAFITGYITKSFILQDLHIITLSIASISAGIFELISKGNWDNFTIPIGTGLILSYLPTILPLS